MPTSSTLNGAEAILEILRLQGTDFLFCSPISVWAPLWEALAKRKERGAIESPRYVNCRHEILAVGLASGYYKATGRPQVVLLPTGLGVLHGSMALRSAFQERIPMTVLAPDTLTYGELPDLDPGPEWPSLLVDLTGPARAGRGLRQMGEGSQNQWGSGRGPPPGLLLRRLGPPWADAPQHSL